MLNKESSTLKDNILFILLSGVIIAMLAGSLLPANYNQSANDQKTIYLKLKNIAEKHNIEFSNQHLSQFIPEKHNFTKNKDLYEHINLTKKSEIIQNIINSIKINKLQKIIHHQLDEIKNILIFEAELDEKTNIIPSFLKFQKQVKKILLNTKDIQTAIKKIKEISQQHPNILYRQKKISFFSDDNDTDYDLLTYKHGILSPVKQKDNKITFSIIESKENGYFQAHNIPHEVFHKILLHDILQK